MIHYTKERKGDRRAVDDQDSKKEGKPDKKMQCTRIPGQGIFEGHRPSAVM